MTGQSSSAAPVMPTTSAAVPSRKMRNPPNRAARPAPSSVAGTLPQVAMVSTRPVSTRPSPRAAISDGT